MSFFKKMRERMFRSSSKLDEGLTALVDEGEDVVEPAVPPAPAAAEITMPSPANLTAPDPARSDSQGSAW
jgi:fused signal recognition particle receptor